MPADALLRSRARIRWPGKVVKPGWTRTEDPISDLNIGPRLRALREAAGISLRTLAERTGFSPSFVSQVELEQSSPSIASLQRLCAALDVELADFLRQASHNDSSDPVIRRGDRQILRSEWSKAVAESVLPAGADDRLTAVLIVLDVGGRTGHIERRKRTREFAYCIRGSVALIAGDTRYELGGGDAALLDDMASTAWENTGRSRAEIMLVRARVADR